MYDRSCYTKESSRGTFFAALSGLFRGAEEIFRYLFQTREERRLHSLRAAVPEDPAEFLGCGEETLRRMASAPETHYQKFFLWKDKKHTRKRIIEAPDKELKRMQRRILPLLYHLAPSPYAHGFTIGRSIVSNAEVHTGKRYVVKLDLKDFFPSVTREMIEREMRELGIFSEGNRTRIETLLALCLYEGRLPQGAPTSPAISNLVCRKLDFILAEFARKHRMRYSRYADDLTFSSDSDDCYKMIPLIEKIVRRYGFRINPRKVNVRKRHQRQTVTGIVVNRKGCTSVPRRKRMKLRAFMHQIITGEIPLSKVNFARLKGHVSFVSMANARQGEYFQKQLEIIQKMRTGS